MSTPEYARLLGFTTPTGATRIRDIDEAITANAVRAAALIRALVPATGAGVTDVATAALAADAASNTRQALDALYKLTGANGGKLDAAVTALINAATGTRGALDGRYAKGADLSGPWKGYVPTVGGGGWALGNGATAGAYRQLGQTVQFHASLTFGSSTVAGSGQLALGLPAAALEGRYVALPGVARDVSPSAFRTVHGLIVSGASVVSMFNNDMSDTVRAGVPFAWAVGDQVHVSGAYEAA